MSEPHAHPHVDVAGFEHTLTKKAGPLPVWAWGLGIGAVLVVFLWLHNRDNAAAPTTAYDDTATLDGQDSGLAASNAYDDAYQSGFSAGAGSGTGSDTSDASDDTLPADTDGTATSTTGNRKHGNAAWLRRAAAFLVASGIANPIRASNILNRYLAGEPLTHKQRHIANQALKNVGLPPTAPTHVSNTAHQQHPTHGANSDHPDTKPHTSNAQPGQDNPHPWETGQHHGQQQHHHHHAGAHHG